MDGLTNKQRLFVEYYLGECNFNAAAAARKAGYSARTAKEIGRQLLTKLDLQEAIRARLAEAAMGAEEVLARLADQARGTMADFMRLRKDGKAVLDLKRAEAAGKLHLVKELTTGKDGTKVRLYDAQAALVKIGTHHGLFKEQHEFSGPGGAPIPYQVIGYDVVMAQPPAAPEPDGPGDDNP